MRMVPRGGIEPPTRGFSILCSFVYIAYLLSLVCLLLVYSRLVVYHVSTVMKDSGEWNGAKTKRC